MNKTRICKNCRQEFGIAPEDTEFYDKIKVPAPTWCPDCRMMRRMSWRNERNLYKRQCDMCQKSIISIYSPDKPHKVYCQTCYHGDRWDGTQYGRDYDFSRPFFEQFRELQIATPRIYAFVFQNTNSEYTNGAAFNKNCYLIFVSDHNEDSSYSHFIMYCRDSMDCLDCHECELCYECVSCQKCYQTFFSRDCVNSRNVWFGKNCSNCNDCFGCVNLRNAQYQIYNQQYSKEDYFTKLQELKLDTLEGLASARVQAHSFWLRFPVKYMLGIKNVDVTGDAVSNSKNTKNSFNSELLEDCKYINYGNGAKNVYEAHVAVDGCEFSYEIIGAIALQNTKFSFCAWHCFDTEYSDMCENSNNLFGCVSLKKKSYCILNKQYSPGEYKEMVAKIKEQMTRDGEYGGFFPFTCSPFAYNETAAFENFPVTKEAAVKAGYQWKEPEVRDYKIGGDIYACSNPNKSPGCATAFRVTPNEREFYERFSLPVPNLCPNCRHAERLKLRNPLKLWPRKCMKEGCTNEFETSFAPDRPEIVYCESCYQQEVL